MKKKKPEEPVDGAFKLVLLGKGHSYRFGSGMCVGEETLMVFLVGEVLVRTLTIKRISSQVRVATRNHQQQNERGTRPGATED